MEKNLTHADIVKTTYKVIDLIRVELGDHTDLIATVVMELDRWLDIEDKLKDVNR